MDCWEVVFAFVFFFLAKELGVDEAETDGNGLKFGACCCLCWGCI